MISRSVNIVELTTICQSEFGQFHYIKVEVNGTTKTHIEDIHRVYTYTYCIQFTVDQFLRFKYQKQSAYWIYNVYTHRKILFTKL